jgi:formylmethanofuran dehydrogenase subunit E
MPCTISQETIDRAIVFHGHSCPGLAIGIRAAELALLAFDNPPDTELVAIVETDMCGVDAIQFLTGCTMGKGNLIHRDYGKMAFSFHHRPTGKGFRALLRPDVRGGMDDELGALMRKVADGSITEEERQRQAELRMALQQRFMQLELEEMFDVAEIQVPPPRPARILESLSCDACGETTMESRTRRFGGRTLCIPCFQAVEQKI